MDAAAFEGGQRAVAGDHGRLAHARDAGHAEQRADLALVHGAAAAERGSSSWSASSPPAKRWYCSALRIIPAEMTGLPSS